MKLTADNYSKGFLIDEELMGGVTEHPEQKGAYMAYVLRHTTGEYLGYQPYENLDQALMAINTVERAWDYEKTSACGGFADGACGKGMCSVAKGGSCKMGSCETEAAK